MGCTESSPEDLPEDPYARVVEQIKRAREELRQKPELLEDAAAFARYLSSTNNKQSCVIQYVTKELNEEFALRHGLHFHIANQDAVDVYTASKGIGCDEAKMCAVIIGRRPESIRITDEVYRQKYDASLEKIVRGENVTLLGYLTGGLTDFGKFLTYRTMEQPAVMALLIRKCMTGMGCSDYNLMEILTTQTNADLKAAAEHYQREFEEDMIERIASETSGMLKKHYNSWAKCLCEFDRDETTEVPDNVDDLAQELYDAGASKMMGCDEEVFERILCKANEPTCQAIREAYGRVTEGRDLIEDVKSKMTGDLEFAVVARLRPRYEFYATQIYRACKGLGTDEGALCRILGINDNEECLEMAKVYNEFYSDQDEPYNDFRSLMESELSGDLLDAIVLMLEAAPPAGHWKDPASYTVAASEAGQIFSEEASASLDGQIEAATALGKGEYDGPLNYFSNPDDGMFLIPGCDFDVKTVRPVYESAIELDEERMYEFSTDPVQPEDGEAEPVEPDVEAAEAYLGEIQDKIAEYDAAIEEFENEIEESKQRYRNLAFVNRATAHHAAQLMLDNSNMLEFCAQRDAENVNEACEGWGTDEDALINILAALSKPQMKRVNEIYAEKYGKSMSDTLDGELSGFFGGSTDFQYFMGCLVNDTATNDAEFLKEAMVGWGTDEKLLTEVVCTRTNAELNNAKVKFEELNGKSVQDWIEGDTSGRYERFLLMCLQGRRNEDDGNVDMDMCANVARTLWKCGLSGEEEEVNEDAIMHNLAYASIAQIKGIGDAFAEAYGKSLNEAIKDVMGGDLENAMIIRACDKYEYFADAINKAWEGFGTDETATSRILGYFSKKEVRKIAAMYEKRYPDKGGFQTQLVSECGGNYKKAIMAYLYTEMPGYEELEGDAAPINVAV